MSREQKILLVKARSGVRVPREGQPRQYITDAEPARVASSTYYRRQLRDGSLVIVDEPKLKKNAGGEA